MKEVEEEHKAEPDETTRKKQVFEKHKLNKYIQYVNFNNREDKIHDVEDFSWDFHAYDLYSKFLPNLVEAVHNQMKYAFNMTNNTYGTKTNNIDTSYFRQSIVYYMQMIHGLRDDQFNSQDINKVL